MKPSKFITIILTMLLSMTSSILLPKANSNIMAMELRIGAETGLFVQIVESHEADLLKPVVQPYFEPFQDEALALEMTNSILQELKRYQVDVLQRLNIRFYLVHTKTNIAGLTFMSKPKSGCEIYISASRDGNYQQEAMTLHHEIFHCYDKDEAIASWANQFAMSSHVKNTWGTIHDSTITVDYAGEERAEYFASLLTNDFKRFDDDAQKALKQQAILSDVYTLIHDTSQLPELRTFYVRSWSEGRIKEISEVSAMSQLIRHYEFDYRNSSYILTDYLSNTRSVISMID